MLGAEEVEQDAHALRAVHVGTQTEAIAQRAAEDPHPRCDPQPAQLDHARVKIAIAEKAPRGS